jgi:G3E family GTPase
MLVHGTFKDVLDIRASICLVDPEKLKDQRYTSHENFIDQIALSDVLVA